MSSLRLQKNKILSIDKNRAFNKKLVESIFGSIERRNYSSASKLIRKFSLNNIFPDPIVDACVLNGLFIFINVGLMLIFSEDSGQKQIIKKEDFLRAEYFENEESVFLKRELSQNVSYLFISNDDIFYHKQKKK